jgi:hypothetical protein
VKFRAVVEQAGEIATAIEVPDDVMRQLDSGQRPEVVIGVGAHIYRTTIAPTGERYVIPLADEDRDAAGVSVGDYITVDIELDQAGKRTR